MYSGLIHSHLVYGAPIWGFAPKNRLDRLLKQQKKAIRRIFNLQYRDHTYEYFHKGRILKIPELMAHTTMCYIQSGLHFESPYHISSLWSVKTPSAINLRQTGLSLEYTFSKKD